MPWRPLAPLLHLRIIGVQLSVHGVVQACARPWGGDAAVQYCRANGGPQAQAGEHKEGGAEAVWAQAGPALAALLGQRKAVQPASLHAAGVERQRTTGYGCC